MKLRPACDEINPADDPDITLCDRQGNAIYVGYHIHSDGTGCVAATLDCETGSFIQGYGDPVRVPLGDILSTDGLVANVENTVWFAADWWLESGKRPPAYQRELRKVRTRILNQIKSGYVDLD